MLLRANIKNKFVKLDILAIAIIFKKLYTNYNINGDVNLSNFLDRIHIAFFFAKKLNQINWRMNKKPAENTVSLLVLQFAGKLHYILLFLISLRNS